MTEEQLRDIVLTTIGKIAPEADLGRIEPDRRFRDQFDFDSVDFLNFALALQEKLHIPIPENDFPRLATLNGCIGYVRSKIHG